MSAELRDDLPELPSKMRKLPVYRGYPVPWFVEWFERKNGGNSPDHSQPTRIRGMGIPDFRIMAAGAIEESMKKHRCWTCGQIIYDSHFAYVAGPMCGVNRTSAEPPNHVDCADFAGRACPFLAKPTMVRREAGMPEERLQPAGQGIMRNPGVAMIWVATGAWEVKPDGRGNLLFNLQDPTEVRWYEQGRPADMDAVTESVSSGLPLLIEAEPDAPPEAAADLFDHASEFLAEWGPRT